MNKYALMNKILNEEKQHVVDAELEVAMCDADPLHRINELEDAMEEYTQDLEDIKWYT